jgi:hypothetical protein
MSTVWRCAALRRMVRCARATALPSTPSPAVPCVDAGFRVEVEVFGVFTRALREENRCRMYACSPALSARSRGSCRTCRLTTRTTSSIKDIRVRVDSSNANYNGGLRSTGYSTGVAKKELNAVKSS